jgi:hypothetical protein
MIYFKIKTPESLDMRQHFVIEFLIHGEWAVAVAGCEDGLPLGLG